MPTNRAQLFLLAYDIADPKRLTEVHRTVRRWGVPLQYSVFLVPTSPAGIDGLLSELAGIIDARADDIRVYPLPSRLDVLTFGRQLLPEGVSLVGAAPTDHALASLVGSGSLH
ncbi:MAG: CRISPR-associated endonuclease Cas2 [Chromatiaceae bacterium]|jgi:CRISPR-associated protein Cas2|nr:CRISPR-associated endonuclease Cas2 [Chromatiaceae bacterium]